MHYLLEKSTSEQAGSILRVYASANDNTRLGMLYCVPRLYVAPDNVAPDTYTGPEGPFTITEYVRVTNNNGGIPWVPRRGLVAAPFASAAIAGDWPKNLSSITLEVSQMTDKDLQDLGYGIQTGQTRDVQIGTTDTQLRDLSSLLAAPETTLIFYSPDAPGNARPPMQSLPGTLSNETFRRGIATGTIYTCTSSAFSNLNYLDSYHGIQTSRIPVVEYGESKNIITNLTQKYNIGDVEYGVVTNNPDKLLTPFIPD
jgi:hypothetical protein